MWIVLTEMVTGPIWQTNLPWEFQVKCQNFTKSLVSKLLASHRDMHEQGNLTISTSRSAVSISPISESTWRQIGQGGFKKEQGQGLSASLPSMSFSFSCRMMNMFHYFAWSPPSPSWCSCRGSCRRERRHAHARPPGGRGSRQPHLQCEQVKMWTSENVKAWKCESGPPGWMTMPIDYF